MVCVHGSVDLGYVVLTGTEHDRMATGEWGEQEGDRRGDPQGEGGQ